MNIFSGRLVRRRIWMYILGLPHGFWGTFSYVKGYEEMGG